MKITATGVLSCGSSSLKINGNDLLSVIAEHLGAEDDGYGYKFGEKVCSVVIEITDLETFCAVDGVKITAPEAKE